jgi:ferredoxin
MTYVIAEPCVDTKDTACVEVCPVDCIHPKKDEAFAREQALHRSRDLHRLRSVFPYARQAIFPLEELPEKWANYAQMGVDRYKNKK